jgi:hypothetical protein
VRHTIYLANDAMSLDLFVAIPFWN